MAHVPTYLPKVETLRKWKDEKQMAYQSVVKRDWVPTGRIDFATRLNGNATGPDQPTEFKCARGRTQNCGKHRGKRKSRNSMEACDAKEAKAVVAQYHKYLSEHSLIRTVFEDTLSLPPPKRA
jgi:hypothetical protein